MKDIILLCSVSAIFTVGFFIMGKVDKFIHKDRTSPYDSIKNSILPNSPPIWPSHLSLHSFYDTIRNTYQNTFGR